MFKRALSVLFLSMSVFSYSYTAYPPVTGPGIFAVNPVFFADKVNSGGTELFLYYGLTDKMDLSTSILTNNGISSFSAMARYDFGGFKILGVRANTSLISPQFSLTLENEHLYFQGTAASQITFSYADKPALYGILCPGVKPLKFLDVFCEVNPGYYMLDGDFANCAVREKGAAVDIVPGVGLTIGGAVFSIAVPIYNVNKTAAVTFGAWVYYSIGGDE